MLTVEDYLSKVKLENVLYINKIPLGKIVPEEIPVYNPLTLKYKKLWESEIEKCIDGFWVEHEGEHKYVPGVLYFYGAHWHILLNPKNAKSKTKKIARPFIRDLEWIKSYLYVEARGFSGFEEDDEFSCHRELAKPEEERTPEFMDKTCFNKKGKPKKYVPAREYLWKYHKKPLGKALFGNMALNVVDLESRGCLAPGTKIRMFDGSIKPIENISKGDIVMGDDYTARKVLWTYSGTANMYTIKSDLFDTISVNEEHKIPLLYESESSNKELLYTRLTPPEIMELHKQEKYKKKLFRYAPEVLPDIYKYAHNSSTITVEESGLGAYYGFKLDGNCKYLLADYTVDHNTGKSYTMSGFCGHNFIFDGAQDFHEYWTMRKTREPLSSETLVGAIDSKYSDDLIKKVKLGLESFEGEYSVGNKTYPAPLSKSYSGQWNAGKTVIQEVEKKIGGQWVKTGTRSKFQHRSFMDNPFAANGTRAGFNVLDEVGFMGNLQAALVQMKECTADGALKFGTIWMTGTGGDMDGGATQAVMAVFFDPETNDCVAFDDNYEGTDKKMGFFVPAWMGLNQFKDEFGNTNYKAAIQYILNARNRLAKGKDKAAYNGELSQRPIIPSEVFLISGGNILPVGKLKEQLDFLETTPDPKYEGVLGHMKMDADGEVSFVPDVNNELAECSWPVKKGEDHTGAVHIWEQPATDIGFGYYLAGNDPYDQDKAPNSVSLGSLLVMKRVGAGISPYDMIVAEYTARPETAKDFYEQCRLLLMYYQCAGSCLYENEKIGIKTYLENNNSLYLLAPTPTIMKSNRESNVNRGLGQHMSTTVKEECEIFLRDWLVESSGEGKLNLHRIYSKPLLKELINYNKSGNFDRVIALMLCVVQKTQMHKIVVEKAEEAAEDDTFFQRPIFSNYEGDSFKDMISNSAFSSNFS